MGLVVDTSALIALDRAGTDWEQTLGPHAEEPVAMPAVVYGELLVGVALAGSRKRAARRRERIDALVAVTGIVDFDAAIAEQWAELFASSAGADASSLQRSRRRGHCPPPRLRRAGGSAR